MGLFRACRFRDALGIAAWVGLAASACASDPPGGAVRARAAPAPAPSSESSSLTVVVPREAGASASSRPVEPSVVDCTAKPAAPGCPATRRPGAARLRVSENAIVVPSPIEFEPRLPDPTPASLEIVKDVASFLLDHPELERVEIGVHSNPQGSSEYNLALTQSRADAVADILRKAGVAPARIQATGFGETRATATARVELVVLKGAPPH